MIDREWLKKNTERCIESIKKRPTINAEQQGLLNVLTGTLLLIEETEYILNRENDEIIQKF